MIYVLVIELKWQLLPEIFLLLEYSVLLIILRFREITCIIQAVLVSKFLNFLFSQLFHLEPLILCLFLLFYPHLLKHLLIFTFVLAPNIFLHKVHAPRIQVDSLIASIFVGNCFLYILFFERCFRHYSIIVRI